MKLKELKELLDKLPNDFDGVEVLTCQIEENSYAFPKKLTDIIYSNTEVILQSRYKEEKAE